MNVKEYAEKMLNYFEDYRTTMTLLLDVEELKKREIEYDGKNEVYEAYEMVKYHNMLTKLYNHQLYAESYIMASEKRLDPESLRWRLTRWNSVHDNEINLATELVYEKAMKGGPGLPEGFTQWAIESGKLGYTVAHEAAKWGQLPKEFDSWRIADRRGWTVAHEAAYHAKMPQEIDKKILLYADCRGETVAHVMARNGTLPRTFKKWRIENKERETVALLAYQTRHITKKQYERYMGIQQESEVARS